MNNDKLRVGIVTYGACFQRVGGIQNQINETIKALDTLGIDADIIADRTDHLAHFDLIHVFASAHGNYTWINEANRQNIPVVCSPVIQPNYSFSEHLKIKLFKKLSDHLLSGIAGENIFSSLKATYKSLEHSQKLIVQSTKELMVLNRIFNTPTEKCVVLPNGVSERYFVDHLNENKKQYLFLPGAIYPHKNQHIGIELAHKLGLKAVLAGEILDTNYFNNISATFSNVCYAGVLKPESEELIKLYRDAKATVLLSKSETFGLVAIESLAMGTPVILTKHTGLDSSKLGQFLIKVDPNNNDEVLREAKVLLNKQIDPSELRYSASSYSWKEIGIKLANLYSNVIIESRRS